MSEALKKSRLSELLGIDFPIIMAPMFLVSNIEMTKIGMANGIAACIPSLNYRTEEELSTVLNELNMAQANCPVGKYGINLIVQNTNPKYKLHLDLVCEYQVPFVITSLGDPTETISRVGAYGGKVLCDITNLKHARKAARAGCDGFIVVGQGAGGHAGPHPLQTLIPEIQEKYPEKIIVAAGGIATGSGVLSCLSLGADGVSVGTRFIASTEAEVSQDYKNAIVQSGNDDIVMTTKLSGTPCSIINTPYAQRIGTEQNWLQKWLNKNRRTKKIFKAITQFQGTRKLEKASKEATYKTLWSAGKSSALIKEVKSCSEITGELISEFNEALNKLKQRYST